VGEAESSKGEGKDDDAEQNQKLLDGECSVLCRNGLTLHCCSVGPVADRPSQKANDQNESQDSRRIFREVMRSNPAKGSYKMTMPSKLKNIMAENALFYVIGLLIAFGLKYFYHNAGSDDLNWILVPTARVVEYLSGIHFERELYIGLVNHAYRFIIVPSCAGVNFLTITFSTIFFSFVHRLKGMGRKSLWLGISAGFAYLLTLVANALRIIAAIYLYRADIYGGWVTMERIHRIEGVFIYFFFLLVAYLTVERVFQGVALKTPGERRSPAPEGKEFMHIIRRCLVPFFWYSLIGLGIPLVRMTYRQDVATFTEHFSSVTLVCLCILLLLFVILLGYRTAACAMKQLKK
jgi:exosortase K